MNFGHIFGGHHLGDQWQLLLHYLVSWAPIALAGTLALVTIVIFKQQILAFVKERIQKQK